MKVMECLKQIGHEIPQAWLDNPADRNYTQEWCFDNGNHRTIMLWEHIISKCKDGSLYYEENLKESAKAWARLGRTQRARKCNKGAAFIYDTFFGDQKDVNVIIVTRDPNQKKEDRWTVKTRNVDPKKWHVSYYSNGDFVLTRND